MDESERTRLAKLLARTASDHDGEALAAIRKANEFLQRRGLGWDSLLAANKPPPAPRRGAGGGLSWPDKPATADFRRYDAPMHDVAGGFAGPAPGEDSAIGAFAAAVWQLLAFPLHRMRAYRVHFRAALSPGRRLAILLWAPFGVAAWCAACWAAPLGLMFLLASQAVPPRPTVPLSQSEFAAIRRQVASCWRQPEDSKYADFRATVVVTMNPDATVERVGLAQEPGDPAERRFAESAVAAVIDPQCQPYPLPSGRYDAWKTISLTFVSRRPPR